MTVHSWRLFVDAPQSGAWNMAVDEALLETAGPHEATLRLYQWSEPTLSLGYFQAAADRARHPASGQCPLVRRASGGGAIVHDRELTYSLVLGREAPLARQPLALYRTIHATLADVLTTWGLPTASFMPRPESTTGDAPFLCFQRRSEGDLLAGDHKLVGSAQRRRSGAVLQHGSILLERSVCAPELPGIAEVAGRPLAAAQLIQLWLSQLQRALNIALSPASLSPPTHTLAQQLVVERHTHSHWINRR